jgi:K+-sensing histidine kinase KdpD
VQNEPDPQNRESNTDSGMGSSQNTNQSLYEKDQIGYGYSNDRLEALQALSLPTPEHKNTYTAHFTVGKEAIGEMQVEPRDNQEFTNDQTSLVNAVVQQASLQIQNLRLLSATNRARAEAEFATRRFMHEGWESYLDAI